MTPDFIDLRGVTQPIDCVLAGKDPYLTYGCEPLVRLRYNYPPVWLGLRYLGVTSRSTDLLGAVMAALLALTLVLLLRANRWLTALFVGLAVFEYPVLFATERGNTDIIVFSLLVIGTLLLGRGRRSSLAPSGVLIVLLTTLKVYPLVAAVGLLRSKAALRTVVFTFAGGVVVLLLTVGHRFSSIAANTPQEIGLSFGMLPLLYVLEKHLSPATAKHLLGTRWPALALGVVIASVAVTLAWRFRERLGSWLPVLDLGTARGRLAGCCLSIFCFVFASGASFNYRLLYLLGPLALLIDHLNRQRSARVATVAGCLLAALLAPYQSRPLPMHLANLLVFVICSGWLGVAVLGVLLERRVPEALAEPEQVRARAA